MKRSILWNGFEIKKGDILTETGNVPYIYYCPYRTDQIVNIAIHGEGSEKEDWLSFNSTSKFGNLLKESIKKNSPFIAFDLYGHGEWIIDDHNLNILNLSEEDKDHVISNSITGIKQAITNIIKVEGLEDNPIGVTAYSLGCNVALGLKLDNPDFKTVLISPLKSEINTSCKNFFVLRGKDDVTLTNEDFNNLYKKLPEKKILEKFPSNHEIPESWINKARKFIYE